jgi:hypothetical protein
MAGASAIRVRTGRRRDCRRDLHERPDRRMLATASCSGTPRTSRTIHLRSTTPVRGPILARFTIRTRRRGPPRRDRPVLVHQRPVARRNAANSLYSPTPSIKGQVTGARAGRACIDNAPRRRQARRDPQAAGHRPVHISSQAPCRDACQDNCEPLHGCADIRCRPPAGVPARQGAATRRPTLNYAS